MTFTTKQIWKSLKLVQNGVEHTVQQQKANIHLDESTGVLQLYVPSDRGDRELCYLRQLPRRLLDFLAISDPAAEAVISEILNSSRLFVVDEILKDAGVIEVDGIQRPPEAEEDEQDVSDGTGPPLAEYPSSYGVRTPSSSSATPERYILSEPSFPIQNPLSASHSSAAQSRNSPSSLIPDLALASVDTPYAKLLERIIVAARNTVLPGPEQLSFSTSGSFHLDIHPKVFGQRSNERNAKVGAAGELFVRTDHSNTIVQLNKMLML